MSSRRITVPVSIAYWTLTLGLSGCDVGVTSPNSAAISGDDRLELLIENPPPKLTDEQVVAEIVSYYPLGASMQPPPQYSRIVQNAGRDVPYALEIQKKWSPAVDHFISAFDVNKEPAGIWNTEAFFGDRYILTMQVRINVDEKTERIKLIEEPRFLLREPKNCDRRGGAQYGPSQSKWFTVEEFQSLVNARWDFEAIGISIDSTPVENFPIYQAMTRSPRPQFRLK